MDPITIVLAIAGLIVGAGGTTAYNRQRSTGAAEAAKKELSKAKKEADL